VQDRVRSPAWAVGSAALGLSVAALALLGPMAGEVVRYRVPPSLRAELAGSDLVTVGLIAPLAVLAAVLARRGSPLGPLLALGPASASWYLLAALLLGADRSGRFPGNDEVLLPLLVALLVLASAVAAGAWRAVPRRRVVFDHPTGVLLGVLLLLLCLVDLFGRYLPAWLDVVEGRGAGDYARGPGFWWALAVLHLALALPAAAVTGIGLLRRARWAGLPAFGLSGGLALVALAATARSVAAMAHGEDRFAAGTAVWLAVQVLVSTAPAAVCWLAVARTGERAWRQATEPPGEPSAPPPPRTPRRDGTTPVLPVPRRPAEAVGGLDRTRR
jgi:hypothetical protein